MAQRRKFLASAVVGLLCSVGLEAQPVDGVDEPAVREAFSRFQEGLTRHDVVALRTLLTTDAVWVLPDSVSKNSGDDVATYLASAFSTYEMKLELVRLKMVGRDAATLVLRGQVFVLPQRDGKYTMVFNRDPMLSRWRRENGKWRLSYMMADVPQAAELVKAEGLE